MSYYIIKRRVYVQGVYGPYNTEEDAIAAFWKAYKEGDYYDFDGAHSYNLTSELSYNIGNSTIGGFDEKEIKYQPRKKE